MTFCAWCGTAVPPGDRFCSRCGRPVAAPLPPAPSTFPVHLVVFLIVLFVGGSIALSAVFYEMTSGLINSPNPVGKPVITLTITKTSTGADILVAGIYPTAAPSNFRVTIEDVSSTTFGTPVGMPTSPSGVVSVTVGTGATPTVFSIQWQNPGGSGQVSQGDHFVITATGAYVTGNTYSFLLIWSDGSTLSSVDWQV